MKLKPFKGELGTPIVEPHRVEFNALKDWGELPPDADFEEWRAARVYYLRAQKIPALMTALGVQGGTWRDIALALASELVPGFQTVPAPQRGRGRPGEWDEWRYLELFLALEKTRLENGLAYGQDPSRLLDLHLGIANVSSEAHRLRLRDNKGHSTLRNNYSRCRNPHYNPLVNGYDQQGEEERARRRAHMTDLLAITRPPSRSSEQ